MYSFLSNKFASLQTKYVNCKNILLSIKKSFDFDNSPWVY